VPLARGTRLGPYEINDRLGAGGMGEVYRACHTRLVRDVAVKVIPEELAAQRRRSPTPTQSLRRRGPQAVSRTRQCLLCCSCGRLEGTPGDQ
jgi:serine/threonine protein kinase